MMKRVLACIAATSALAFSAVTAAPSAHAEQVICAAAPKFSGLTVPQSQLFRATKDCNGVYAFGVYNQTDYVRGRFYKDGGWQISSYGWVKIYKENNGADKVVGNTITGREIKGQVKTVPQQVAYLY